MRPQSLGCFTFFLNRIMSEQRSSRTAMTFSECGVDVAVFRVSRETAEKINSTSARVWYLVGTARKEGGAAVTQGLALLCAVVLGSES